jgi:hypothetical protein
MIHNHILTIDGLNLPSKLQQQLFGAPYSTNNLVVGIKDTWIVLLSYHLNHNITCIILRKQLKFSKRTNEQQSFYIPHFKNI